MSNDKFFTLSEIEDIENTIKRRYGDKYKIIIHHDKIEILKKVIE